MTVIVQKWGIVGPKTIILDISSPDNEDFCRKQNKIILQEKMEIMVKLVDLGKSGGNIFGISEKLAFDANLIINTIGDKGSKGQDGGDGAQGIKGKIPIEEAIRIGMNTANNFYALKEISVI